MPYTPGELGLGASTPADGTYRPGELSLPPRTPGGLATGVNGERLGATNVAANGQVGEDLQSISTVTVITPETNITTSSTGVLRYPQRRPIGSDTDWTSVEFFEYVPPFSTNSDKAGGVSDYSASIASKTLSEKKSDISSIVLPMPEDVQAQYGANWGGAGFGALFGALAQGSTGNLSAETAQDKILTSVKTKIYKEIVDAVNKGLGTSVTPNQIIGGREGKIINPNVEMMYEAPELRNFAINFKMFATDQAEANNIRGICNAFKKAMLPSISGGGAGFIKVPNICRISFMTGSTVNPYVSQFKPAAITNVSVNYTPDGAWAAYEQGAPIAVQLSVQFKELKLIFREEITDGSATY